MHPQYSYDTMMSQYPGFPTPPSHLSDGSNSPNNYVNNTTTITYLNVHGCDFSTMNISENGPYLHIIEQPVDRFRFRYKSEMAGTHGCLNGKNSERNKKATFPTVELRNFDKTAIIRCSLYQYSVKGVNVQPHAHRLVIKNGTNEEDDPHDKVVTKAEGYKAVFKNMGIIHTARKYIQDELLKKKTKLKIEELLRYEGRSQLNIPEKADITNLASDEAKTINLNTVCLRFDAFVREHNNALKAICQPIYSHPINNLKSALTGELKIVRMDMCTSPAIGGREVFLLVEKVTKKNIKVRLFELVDGDEEIWSAFATFNDIDVHHQYAIVIKVPPYRDPEIGEERRVYIELYRPSDGARSDPLEFTYFPDRQTKRKRSRYNNHNNQGYDSNTTSLSSFSSSEIPLAVRQLPELLFPDGMPLTDYAKDVNSDEFKQVLAYAMPETDLLFSTRLDAAPTTTMALQQQKKQLHDAKVKCMQRIENCGADIYGLWNTKPSADRIEALLRKSLKDKVESNNILHLSFMKDYQCDKTKSTRQLILSLIKRYALYDLLNLQNNKQQTIAHLAIENKQMGDLKAFLNLIDLTKQDENGNTVLHYAITCNNSLSELIENIADKSVINKTNDDKVTPLQLAIATSQYLQMQLLIKAGADVNVLDGTSGDTLLHTSIKNEDLETIEYLLEHTAIDLRVENYTSLNCYELALRIGNTAIIQLLSARFAQLGIEVAVKQECDSEEGDDDDEEEEEMLIDEDEEVKKEMLTDDDRRDVYITINDIPPKYMTQIAHLIHKSAKLHAFSETIEMRHILDAIDDEDGPKKVEIFLKASLMSGVSVYQIRMELEKMELLQVVDCIDQMAMETMICK